MQSDEALYCDARQGSKLAFEKLYLRYEQPLFGYILRHLHNRQDAEEVFHEAMLTIMKSPVVDFPKSGAFAGWLYKVALNLSLNHLRSGKRSRQVIGLFQHEPRTEVAEEDSRPEQVALAAQSLSRPLSEVYQLRIAGKNYEDIAAHLQVPLGTVKSRMHQIIAQLRKGMEKWTAK